MSFLLFRLAPCLVESIWNMFLSFLLFFFRRPVPCNYKNLGCSWDGLFHQLESHTKECLYPQKTGAELLDEVSSIAAEAKEEVKKYDDLFRMLSYEKIAICGMAHSHSSKKLFVLHDSFQDFFTLKKSS